MRSRKNSLANNNIIEKIRLRADFFLNFAEGEISLSRSENITATNGSCALRAWGEGAKIFPEEKILLLPNSRQGRRLFEARGKFRPLRRST